MSSVLPNMILVITKLNDIRHLVLIIAWANFVMNSRI